MKCAVGFCGHCQLGPAFVCKDGPVLPLRAVRPCFYAAGGLTMARPQAPTLARLQVRFVRRLPADACWTWRTSCSRIADAVDIAYFREATSNESRGPVRSVARRRFDHHARATPSGSARSARAVALPGERSAPAPRPAASRRCATSATSTRLPRDRLRQARVHRHAGHVDRHRRSRPGRLRAARLPAQQATASGGGERLPAPADAHVSAPQRLRRVQAARQRLRDGDGHARAWGRSRTPGCGALCPDLRTAAATAASAPWRRPTPRRWRRRSRAPGSRARDLLRVFRTFNANAPRSARRASAMRRPE